METVIRHVGEIDEHDREALEHVLGQRLRENQQLVIGIVDVQRSPDTAARDDGTRSLPDWCNVYAGLAEDRIADLEQSILRRANLSRRSE